MTIRRRSLRASELGGDGWKSKTGAWAPVLFLVRGFFDAVRFGASKTLPSLSRRRGCLVDSAIATPNRQDDNIGIGFVVANQIDEPIAHSPQLDFVAI